MFTDEVKEVVSKYPGSEFFWESDRPDRDILYAQVGEVRREVFTLTPYGVFSDYHKLTPLDAKAALDMAGLAIEAFKLDLETWVREFEWLVSY